MVFTEAGQTIKIAKDTMVEIELGGKRIVVSNLNGTFSAIGARCTHMGCNLSNGKMEGERVICPCHGSIFDLKTGQVIRGPARVPEPSFVVKVENGKLMIDV